MFLVLSMAKTAESVQACSRQAKTAIDGTTMRVWPVPHHLFKFCKVLRHLLDFYLALSAVATELHQVFQVGSVSRLDPALRGRQPAEQ